MFLEHDDVYQGGGHQYITLGPKLLEPPGECWSNHDVICALAKRVGAEHRASPEPARDHRLDVAEVGLGHAGRAGGEEVDRLPAGVRQAHYIEGFRYPDKKFRFKPDWKNVPAPRPGIRSDRGVPGLPDHWDVIEKADAKHPFRLATSPSREYLNSSFNEMPTSRARHGPPRVKMHPDDLAKLGIADGARVRMGNERGEIVLAAQAFPGVQRGVVIVESIAPNEQFEGGEGINTLTSAYQAAPYGGALLPRQPRVDKKSVSATMQQCGGRAWKAAVALAFGLVLAVQQRFGAAERML